MDLYDAIETWDNPARAPDTLQRAEFAKRISRGFQSWRSTESLVVSVYGPWGSGKTWVLNKIVEEIERCKEFSVCTFSPWQFENSAQITAEFFVSILEKVGQNYKDEEKARKREELWTLLAQAVTVAQLGIVAVSNLAASDTGFPAAMGAFGNLFNIAGSSAGKSAKPPSISDLRKQLTDLFKEKGSPKLLVVIDDLDRLEDEHIRMVFRLIKTTANFPNVNYLILGERKQLAAALDEISVGGGDRYLEKIVQVPLTLPQAGLSEVRGRLWDGLELISRLTNYQLGKHVERYEIFWRAFLKFHLSNYRSVHRLLIATSFSAKCLTKESTLEVDLLDLVALEFLKLFAPRTYSKIAEDPLDREWFNRNYVSNSGPPKVEEDSPAARALVDSSEIGPVVAFRLLSHLFPDFYAYVPKFIKEHCCHGSDHRKYALTPAERPICDERYQALYFQLSVDSVKFPKSRYKDFTAVQDLLEIIQRFKELDRRGWRQELIEQLNDDPEFFDSESDPRPFLSALSSISDDLQCDGSILENELDTAVRLWRKRFSKVAPEEQIKFIDALFRDSNGITIPLTCLELLRSKNGVSFTEGANVENWIPKASGDEIERLTEVLLPNIRNRIRTKAFPIDVNQAWRFYRLANAIGPIRLEEILVNEVLNDDAETVWAMAIAVVKGLQPHFSFDLFDGGLITNESSEAVMGALSQFASAEFWLEFAEKMSSGLKVDDRRNVIFSHIQSTSSCVNSPQE